MDLFQDNMETIIECLQAQRASTSANLVTAIVSSATAVTTSAADVVTTIETPIGTIVPPTLK